jgi:hypothetical protein
MRETMRKFYSAILLAFLLELCPSMWAQSKVGTTGAQFLGIGIGSRAVAMGGAFTAMKNDASMLYWNPAAIARNERVQTAFIHSNWLVDTRIAWAGATANFGDIGTFGGSVTLLTSGDIERTTENEPDGTGEFFSTSDLSFNLTYARPLTDRFAVGVTAKLISQSLYQSSAQTVAIDLGVLFDVSKRFRLAATMHNFGGTMRVRGNALLITASTGTGLNGNNNGIPAELSTDAWNLPLVFRVGIATEVIEDASNRLTLALDAVNPNDMQPHANLGAEYGWRDMLFVRAGYNQLFVEFAEAGWTLGAGLKYNLGYLAFRLDYTYQSYGRLNAPQWLSLSLLF